MNQALVDFLNHGVLPFVGRAAEIEQVLAFWRATTESTRLRGMLLAGEAGIGKSRIVEEIIPRIVQEGGAVVHTKLYPESAASIAPLIARALRVLNTRRQLNIGDTEETIPSVTAALRRLARLRPTLLLIEDIHLLNGETVREVALLLEALSKDSISILALTRPMELPARGVLERYLVEEISLQQLSAEQVEMLWKQLFGTHPDPAITPLVLEATHGNPLALRSALRGTIKSGAIAYDPSANTWHPNGSPDMFLQILRRNVELLLEGLAAYLSDEEREGAIALASLGEVFAREAAVALIENAPALLDALIFKGIIMTSRTQAAVLPGMASKHPALAFTHTLLHTRLVEQSRIAPEALLRLIASDYPLCSILPFQLLTAASGNAMEYAETAQEAIARAMKIARVLDNGPDWKLGAELLRTAEALESAYGLFWKAGEKQVIEAELLTTRLLLARRSSDHDEYARIVQALMAVTDTPASPILCEYRLKAFSFLHALDRRQHPETRIETWQRAQNFTEAHPELLFSEGYLMYMDSAARSMLYNGETEILHQINAQLSALIADSRATDTFRYQARQIIVFHCLELFTTEEELRDNLHQMSELEPYVEASKRMSFLISKLVLLCSIGHMTELLETAATALPLFRERNLTNNFYFGSLARCCALAGLGGGMEEIEEAMERLCDEAPADIRNFSLFAHMALAEIGLLRDDRAWLRKGAERYAKDLCYLRPEAQMLLTLELGLPDEHIVATAGIASTAFRPILALFRANAPLNLQTTLDTFQIGLQTPIVRLNDVMEKRAILALLAHIASKPESPPYMQELHAAIRAMAQHTLSWLAERRLHPYMEPILAHSRNHLSSEELHHWTTVITTMAMAYAPEHTNAASASRQRTRVTMLGTIEIHRPDGQAIAVRGSRLRTLLGLLAADHMLDAPLKHREFSAIASGSEGDLERARKTLNGIVFRLREVMGHNTVETTAETPQLNLDLVEVDILKAHKAIREAAEALHHGSLLRSHERLLHALDLTRGEVPFPHLYENFFEAVREDFETELRNTLMNVAKRLLAEGDPKSAEELLRRGFDAMTEDEEIADLLRTALILIGKRAEAERIRIRAAIATE